MPIDFIVLEGAMLNSSRKSDELRAEKKGLEARELYSLLETFLIGGSFLIIPIFRACENISKANSSQDKV